MSKFLKAIEGHTPYPWKLQTMDFNKDPKTIITGVGREIAPGYYEILFNTVLPDTDKKYVKEHAQIKANTILASKAPVLAEVYKLLEDVITAEYLVPQAVDLPDRAQTLLDKLNSGL